MDDPSSSTSAKNIVGTEVPKEHPLSEESKDTVTCVEGPPAEESEPAEMEPPSVVDTEGEEMKTGREIRTEESTEQSLSEESKDTIPCVEGPSTEDSEPAEKEQPSVVDTKGDEIKARREIRVLSGMAALLQQMRSSAVEQKEELTEEAPDVNMNPQPVKGEEPEKEKEPMVPPVEEAPNMPKMNRKERRALMQRQAAANGEQQEEESKSCEDAPPAKIPRIEVSYSLENPQLAFSESQEFSSPVPSFGFAASQFSNNYVKLAKFSPCGRFLVSTSQDRNARVFHFNEEETTLSLFSSMPLGDVPYDAVWHPCGDLVATTSRLHPIHLFNVSGGREASYRGINHLDELAAAQTMAFSRDGLKMYAGYNKCIRVFDVRRPGRQLKDIKTWRTQPYKEGQKAIISSISVHPFIDGVYAVGTYGNTIGLYSDRTDFVECMFSGDFSAVTDVKYSMDGMKLYSCGRKTGTIQCFDLRNPGSVLFTMKRNFDTQQKIYFDVDSSDRYLFCGTSDGEIGVFDLQKGEDLREAASFTKIADCSVPCVSLHPRLPIVAACTGQRVFPFPKISDEEECEETAEKEYTEAENGDSLQNSIQLWRF